MHACMPVCVCMCVCVTCTKHVYPMTFSCSSSSREPCDAEREKIERAKDIEDEVLYRREEHENLIMQYKKAVKEYEKKIVSSDCNVSPTGSHPVCDCTHTHG